MPEEGLQIMSDDLEMKAKQLATYLGEALQCTVCIDWKSSFRRFRFYFERQGQAEWTYILEVEQEQLNEQSLEDLLAALERGHWKEVLQTNSLIRIPLFRNGEFAPETEFFPWPTYEGQRGPRLRYGLLH